MPLIKTHLDCADGRCVPNALWITICDRFIVALLTYELHTMEYHTISMATKCTVDGLSQMVRYPRAYLKSNGLTNRLVVHCLKLAKNLSALWAITLIFWQPNANRSFFSPPPPLLGYDRNIPGFPRYSIFGDEKDGVHNLRIENARLEDDGEFQCQVSALRLH